MNILVVDDFQDSRRHIKKILNMAGFDQVYLAGTAAEAFLLLGLDDSGQAMQVDLI